MSRVSVAPLVGWVKRCRSSAVRSVRCSSGGAESGSSWASCSTPGWGKTPPWCDAAVPGRGLGELVANQEVLGGSRRSGRGRSRTSFAGVYDLSWDAAGNAGARAGALTVGRRTGDAGRRSAAPSARAAGRGHGSFDQAHRGLREAAGCTDAPAALRHRASGCAARRRRRAGRPHPTEPARGRPRSAWVLLGQVTPELGEWRPPSSPPAPPSGRGGGGLSHAVTEREPTTSSGTSAPSSPWWRTASPATPPPLSPSACHGPRGRRHRHRHRSRPRR